MNLRIGFEAPGDNPVSRMIAGYDAPGRFSHVALIFDDHFRFDAHADYGCRFHDDIPDGPRWTFIDPGVRPSDVRTVLKFCALHAGDGYDFCGVFAIAKVPFAKEDPSKFFCSELIAAALQTVDVFEGLSPHLLSPNGLFVACAGMTVEG